MKAMLFDIGGTNMRLATASGYRLSPVKILPVPRSYSRAIAVLAEAARRARVNVIAGGLPGPFDQARSKMVQSTNLPSWAGRPFKKDLERASRVKVFLENDCALVGLGESVRGTGRGYGLVAYIGFGTGIGGVRIVDGRIDRNALGFEPGHQIIDWRVRRHSHPSPHPGDWESFVSGGAVHRQTGQPGQNISDRRFWRRMEARAAVGLVNVSLFWSPEVIVLGGSLMKSMRLAEIRKYFHQRLKIFPAPPVIRNARLGDLGGLYGALALISAARRK